MRIAFASPFSARSAIARVSADVVSGLVEAGHEVHAIGTEHEPPADWLPLPAPISGWAAMSGGLARFDILIANVGDNFLYHAGIFPLLGQIPTVGVFHDYYLYNLFSGWLWDHGRRPDHLRALLHDVELARSYGEDLKSWAPRVRAGEIPLHEIAQTTPMTEWVARQCHGALAHSSFYLNRLRSGCAGPVRQAWMPVRTRGVAPRQAEASDRVNVLTVGVMNPNKCVDRVIQAIGDSDQLRARTRYRLAGPITDAETARLNGLASTLGYEGLEISGEVSDAALAQALSEADIICCLRRPVLEGASGSVIEALLAGRPTLVADAGFYADLPDEAVVKAPADVPVAFLQNALEGLVGDASSRVLLGERARRWAEETFQLKPYVAALERLSAETLEAAPWLDLAGGFGRDLLQLGATSRPHATRLGGLLGDLRRQTTGSEPC